MSVTASVIAAKSKADQAGVSVQAVLEGRLSHDASSICSKPRPSSANGSASLQTAASAGKELYTKPKNKRKQREESPQGRQKCHSPVEAGSSSEPTCSSPSGCHCKNRKDSASPLPSLLSAAADNDDYEDFFPLTEPCTLEEARDKNPYALAVATQQLTRFLELYLAHEYGVELCKLPDDEVQHWKHLACIGARLRFEESGGSKDPYRGDAKEMRRMRDQYRLCVTLAAEEMSLSAQGIDRIVIGSRRWILPECESKGLCADGSVCKLSPGRDYGMRARHSVIRRIECAPELAQRLWVDALVVRLKYQCKLEGVTAQHKRPRIMFQNDMDGGEARRQKIADKIESIKSKYFAVLKGPGDFDWELTERGSEKFGKRQWRAEEYEVLEPWLSAKFARVILGSMLPKKLVAHRKSTGETDDDSEGRNDARKVTRRASSTSQSSERTCRSKIRGWTRKAARGRDRGTAREKESKRQREVEGDEFEVEREERKEPLIVTIAKWLLQTKI